MEIEALQKLSIWQQWSSNHSSKFSVVGEFTNPESADNAARKLQDFFDAILQWFEQPENAEASQARYGIGTPQLSQPERDWSKDMGIEWYEFSIDWLLGDSDYRGIYVVDRFVIVQPGQTMQGGGVLGSVQESV